MSYDLDETATRRTKNNFSYDEYDDDPSEPREPRSAMDEAARITRHALDTAAMRVTHTRLMDWLRTEIEVQRENRAEQQLDEAYYDNKQWTDREKQELADRGQLPLVFNVIATTVDWVTGTEKRTRTDWRILPRRTEDGAPAERKTQLMKYLTDVNRTQFDVSRAFSDGVKVGIGWLEAGIRRDEDDEPIYSRYESWRHMLFDSTSYAHDQQDCRYVIRLKWVDLDVAEHYFPARRGVLAASVGMPDLFYADLNSVSDFPADETEMNRYPITLRYDEHSHIRPRVRLFECWYRRPAKVEKLRGGPFSGEIYDPHSRGHVESVESGEAQVIETQQMRMHVAIFTQCGMVWHSQSPYRHNEFPFIPVWGYRDGGTNLPYGMIRRLRGLQDDINKRASKALYILSTNKVIMDTGALPQNWTLERLSQEIARPDAIIEVNPGKRFDIVNDRDLSQYHLELMSQDIALVQSSSGVTDENLGRRTNASSGIAIQRRQDQGSLTSYIFFDNLRLSKQLFGERTLSLIEQFMDQEKQFRIASQRGKPEFVAVNDNLPDNDIVRSKADYVIDEADFSASARQAAANELMQLMQTLPPEISLVLIDLVVDNLDLANREEIVQRIRAITGQRDPDAEEPTPEEIARAQAQQEQQDFQKVAAITALKKEASEAKRLDAQTQEILAKIANTNVSTQGEAINVAAAALASPDAATVADHIVEQSGKPAQSWRQAQPPAPQPDLQARAANANAKFEPLEEAA